MAETLTLDPDQFEAIDDDELTALALAADPDVIVDENAPSFWAICATQTESLLPAWYMPSSVGGTQLARGWRRRVVLVVIISFLVIAASGLCSTYGQIVVA